MLAWILNLGFAGGGTVVPTVTRDGGGDRYGRQKRRYADPPQGRTVPVDGTLYREMFPNQPARFSDQPDTLNPVESPAATDNGEIPRALLAAWLAFDDE